MKYYIYKDPGFDINNPKILFSCQSKTISEADDLCKQATGIDPSKSKQLVCVIVDQNGPDAWLLNKWNII